MIVALCGRRRSGKDTVAKYLVEGHGFCHRKISQPLKDALQVLFGFEADELETDKKELVHPAWGVSPRVLMQYVGTEVFRKDIQRVVPGVGDTFWIKRLIEEVRKERGQSPRIVISDLRFMNEYELMRREWGQKLIVMRVDRFEGGVGAEAETETHVSEREFADIPCDVVLENKGSIDDLCQKAGAAINRNG
jgi:dephospho-CoA kinase